MKRLLSYSTVIILILATACKKPVAFNYRDVRNIKLNNLGFDRSLVTMDLVFYNPNNYGVNLKNVNSDVFLEKLPIGKFTLDTTMHIPKNSEFTVPVKMEVSLKNVLRNSVSLLLNKEVTLGAKGSARVGKGGINITVPFNYEGKQKLNLF